MLETTGNEVWRPVVGYEGLYEISSWGRVRTAPQIKAVTYDERTGHQEVNLTQDGLKVRRTVHHLVLEAFHGPAPGMRTHRRLDGDKQNNRADNLQWRHAEPDAPLGKLTEHWEAKLDFDRADAIRVEFLTEGTPKKQLARKYGVSPSTVRLVLAGKRWVR
jgi:NUMOD4 motif